jgi:hypothetical protein
MVTCGFNTRLRRILWHLILNLVGLGKIFLLMPLKLKSVVLGKRHLRLTLKLVGLGKKATVILTLLLVVPNQPYQITTERAKLGKFISFRVELLLSPLILLLKILLI